MAEVTLSPSPELVRVYSKPRRTKFVVGGLMILAAMVYLVVTAVSSTAQYYLTVNEFWNRAPTLAGRTVRVSGKVIGASIRADAQALTVSFQIVDDEAAPNRPLIITYSGPKPDTLREEATAIVEGRLGEDGIFYANNVLLKCPSRYEQGKEEIWSLQEGEEKP